jgi:hypothetical protein
MWTHSTLFGRTTRGALICNEAAVGVMLRHDPRAGIDRAGP